MSTDIDRMIKAKEKRLYEIMGSHLMDKTKVANDIKKELKELKKQRDCNK